MKIYFAGSIHGGREDQALYYEIVKKLSTYGTVLTEHVANKNLSSYGETWLTPEDIYKRDMAWLDDANVVVAEVTVISMGVGYEIGRAEMLGKKILCIYRDVNGLPISPMVDGDKNLTVVKYKELGDLDAVLAHFLKK